MVAAQAEGPASHGRREIAWTSSPVAAAAAVEATSMDIDDEEAIGSESVSQVRWYAV